MDVASLNVSTVLLLILGLLSVVFLYYNYVYKPHQYFRQLGIPGPSPKPLIGNFDLLKKHDLSLSKVMNASFEKYGPNFGMYLGLQGFLVTKDLDLLKLITIKHSDNFINRISGENIIKLVIDGKECTFLEDTKGEVWKERRHILSPAFSAHKMKLMEPLIKESTERLTTKINGYVESGETVDAQNMYNKMTLEVILSTAFGRAVDVQNGKGGKILESAVLLFGSFVTEGEHASKMLQLFYFLGFSFPKLMPLLRFLTRYFFIGEAMDYITKASQEIIKARRDGGSTKADLLGLMMEAGDSVSEGVLSEGDIVADSVGFLLAGYETTSSALTMISALLASHPDIQEKLAEEINNYFTENPDSTLYEATHRIDYLDMVFNEAMRLFPVVSLTVRICNDDIILKGIQFKKGVSVMIPIYCVHHDPDIWPDPETFDPERFDPKNKASRHACSFLTFGSGPRNCIGMRFAYLEAKMALIEIIRKYRILLAAKTKTPLKPVIGDFLRIQGGVHVQFESRD